MSANILLLYGSTVLIWGTTWLAIKFQLGSVDPMVSVLYRFIAAAMILMVYCKLNDLRMRFQLKDHVFMALQGLVLFSVNYWIIYLASVHLTSGLVAVIFSSIVFMNMINGAIKDIDHDEKGLAKTLAIRLGAKTHKGTITLPRAFQTIGYAIELGRSFLIFLPFLFLIPFNQLGKNTILLRIAVLLVFTIITLYSIYKLFSIKTFDRDRIRKFIGIIVIFMYSTTPIMLSTLNIYIIFVHCKPPLNV